MAAVAFLGVRDLRRVAAQFGLGEPVDVVPLAGGHPDVVKLTTARGAFVLKPAGRTVEAELYARVAQVLNEAGICQARPLRTVGGSLVGDWGHTVQEFLAGQISLAPTPAQTAATMRHVAAYHSALEQVRAPASLRAADTVRTRVASAHYLIDALPGLARRACQRKAARPSRRRWGRSRSGCRVWARCAGSSCTVTSDPTMC